MPRFMSSSLTSYAWACCCLLPHLLGSSSLLPMQPLPLLCLQSLTLLTHAPLAPLCSTCSPCPLRCFSSFFLLCFQKHVVFHPSQPLYTLSVTSTLTGRHSFFACPWTLDGQSVSLLPVSGCLTFSCVSSSYYPFSCGGLWNLPSWIPCPCRWTLMKSLGLQ